MALSDFSLVTLLTFLLGGGGSDLLDYVPTETYWQLKEVKVTSENLLATLKPTPQADVAGLIGQLNSADAAVRDAAAAKIRAAGPGAIPALKEETESDVVEVARRAKSLIQEITADMKPGAVRRLMAIRTLGERKERTGLAALRPLLQSQEPFVAEYAARAIAQIEGKPFQAHRASADEMKKDLWLLPANCAAVGQYAPRGNLAIPFDQALAPMQIHQEQKTERLKTLTEYVLELTEHVGNMRIDGVTLGLSGDISDRNGFLVAIVRGQFDRVAVSELVRQQGTPAGNVDGFDVFQPDNEGAVFFVSDNQAVYMAAPAGTALPLKQMAAAARAGKGGLEKAGPIVELIKKAETDQAVWAVARTTPELRQFVPLVGFDKVMLVGRQEGQTFQFKLEAQGTDDKKVAMSVQEAGIYLKDARDYLREIAPVMPPLQPVRRFLDSVDQKVEGTKLTATATFKGPTTGIIVFTEFPYATAQPVDDEEKAPQKPKAKPEPADLSPRPAGPE